MSLMYKRICSTFVSDMITRDDKQPYSLAADKLNRFIDAGKVTLIPWPWAPFGFEIATSHQVCGRFSLSILSLIFSQFSFSAFYSKTMSFQKHKVYFIHLKILKPPKKLTIPSPQKRVIQGKLSTMRARQYEGAVCKTTLYK